VPEGLDVVPAENLAQVFESLTGDARMERVIEAYCRRVCEEWDSARENPNDLSHYVEPHYALLEKGEPQGPLDSSQLQRLQRPEDEEPRGPKYRSVAADGDSAEDELVKLMGASRRLCISEDAGAGKTVFTRRLQAFLASPEGKVRVLGRRPHLVARFERRNSPWPSDFQSGLIQSLAALVRPDCKRLDPGQSPLNYDQLAREVAHWCLEHGRVVLLLDALDQLGNQ